MRWQAHIQPSFHTTFNSITAHLGVPPVVAFVSVRLRHREGWDAEPLHAAAAVCCRDISDRHCAPQRGQLLHFEPVWIGASLEAVHLPQVGTVLHPGVLHVCADSTDVAIHLTFLPRPHKLPAL